jgi:hypothetical protein
MRKWGKADKARRKETGYVYAESFKRIEFRRPEGAPGSPPVGTAAPAPKRARAGAKT